MRADSGFSERWSAGAFNNGLIFGATYHGVRRLPVACCYGIGDVGSWITTRLMRSRTRALVDNLRVVRPDASGRELEALALLTYRTYARDTIDFIRSLTLTRDQFQKKMALFHCATLDRVLEERRGAIVAGGHFGNWELGGLAVRLILGHPMAVVGRPEPSAAVGRFRRQMRTSHGIETVEIGQMLETALRIRRLLAQNYLVAMLMDRHLGRDRVEVTFFGRRTPFLRSPAMIAQMSGAPLLPAFMIRRADGRYDGWFGQAIYADRSRSTDESIQAATQAFAQQLEAEIRRHPHLWYQFYRYWTNDADGGLA